MTQSPPSLGVAVIGAGMAGRAHIAGYRSASTVYTPNIPRVRLVAVADINAQFAADAARRYGYERALHNLRPLAAVAGSARSGGQEVTVEPTVS
jgi:predicted dehydrogenase